MDSSDLERCHDSGPPFLTWPPAFARQVLGVVGFYFNYAILAMFPLCVKS